MAADQYYQYYEERTPTGIWYIDQLLGGGFKRGEIYLIAGEAGQGKTIFSLQFLKTGAELYDEPGLYITVDEPSEDVKRGVKSSLGWDLDVFEEQQKLVFVDLRTHFKAYSQSEKVVADPREIAKVITDNVKKFGIRRLVVDPIAPLLITSHTDVLWVREYMRELVFQLRKLKDVTTVMTSEIPTGENKISRFGVEEYLASGVIKLELQEYRGFVFRVMFIRKMRWTAVRPQKLVFEIYPQYGIYVIDRLENFMKSIDRFYLDVTQQYGQQEYQQYALAK